MQDDCQCERNANPNRHVRNRKRPRGATLDGVQNHVQDHAGHKNIRNWKRKLAHHLDTVSANHDNYPKQRTHDRVGGAGELRSEKNESVIGEEMKRFEEIRDRDKNEQDRENRESHAARFLR
jgi:hypothetical protein